MQPKTDVVPKGIDPSPRNIWELVDTDKHLEEERNEMDRVSVWAVATIEILDWIRHMRLMVGTV